MKRALLLFLTIGMLLVLPGCGDSMVELTEQEQDLIAEYSVSLLMQYSSGNGNRLLSGNNLYYLGQEEDRKKEIERRRKEAAAEYAASQKEASSSTSDGSGNGSGSKQEATPTYISDLGGFFGLPEFSIVSSRHELLNSYPEDTGRDDMFMAMDATAGNKLLVLHFDVNNISGADADLDMFSKQAKFRLQIDGMDSIGSQYTLLLDDLSMYKGIVPAGTGGDLVLIFEVPESAQGSLGSMVLSARYGDQKALVQVQ